MSKKNNKGLVPKLRFPEFRDSEWIYSELGIIFTNRQETGYVSLPLMSLTEQDGIILQEDTNRKNNSNSDKSKYLRICTGDIAYNTMRMWQGRCAYVNVEGIVSPAYTICKPDNEINGLFFYFYFKTSNLIKKFRANSQGLVNDTLSLKYDAFSRITILYPSKKEQQKIADCLTSLDNLITAETQKLDALKTHKKGLMQKLFPAEGETVPKLRFPEFRDSGEWEEKSLNSIAKRRTERNNGNINRVLTNSAVNGVVDQRDYFEKDIANQNNLDNYYIVDLADYVYNPRISVTAPVGPISKNKVGKGVMSPLYTVFRFDNNNNDFFDHYFKTTCWHKYLKEISNTGARHDRMNISNNDFMNMPLMYPEEKEQQKMADSLTSLDNLINAQSQKIETLKAHKKSLMQQLFPSVDKVDE